MIEIFKVEDSRSNDFVVKDLEIKLWDIDLGRLGRRKEYR